MKALGMLVGLIGLPCLLFPPLGIALIVIGMLMFASGAGAEKRAIEERHRQEMLEAIRQGNNPNRYPPAQ